MKHTPGPWSIEEYGDDNAPALVIHKDSESRICFMATPGSYGDPAQIEADARLIAAAPDLIAALQLLHNNLAEYQKINNLGGYHNHDMKMARVAIAKAEGK